jgi:hypothetical protein
MSGLTVVWYRVSLLRGDQIQAYDLKHEICLRYSVNCERGYCDACLDSLRNPDAFNAAKRGQHIRLNAASVSETELQPFPIQQALRSR